MTAAAGVADPGPGIKRKPGRMPALDGLRGTAVLMVVLYHVGGGATSSFLPLHLFGLVNKAGWTGVTLFFILSGFLITGILWDSREHPHWWRNFYMRRALRIFPLYYLALLLVLLAAAWAHTFPGALSRIWSPALFLQDFPGRCQAAIDYTASPMPLLHFWSLAVEEQFYLVWPLLLALQRDERGARRLFAATFLLCLVLRILLWKFSAVPEAYNETLFTRVGELAAGAWLAIARRSSLWLTVQRQAPVWGVAGLGGFAVTAFLNRSGEMNSWLMGCVGLTAVTIGFCALLVLALGDGVWTRVFRVPALRWLGGISYGVYVFHVLLKPVFDTLTERLVPRPSLLQHIVNLPIVVVTTLIVATLFFRYFEAPFLRLKRHFPE